MIIAAKTAEQPDQTLHQMMETERAKNVKSNKRHIWFKVTAVIYISYVATVQLVHPGGEKKKLIEEHNSPRD